MLLTVLCLCVWFWRLMYAGHAALAVATSQCGPLLWCAAEPRRRVHCDRVSIFNPWVGDPAINLLAITQWQVLPRVFGDVPKVTKVHASTCSPAGPRDRACHGVPAQVALLLHCDVSASSFSLCL